MPADSEQNPLLSQQFRVPFDRIRAADVQPAVTELLRDARERLEAIAAGAAAEPSFHLPHEVAAADPAERGEFPALGSDILVSEDVRTYDNTMRALDTLTEPLDYAMG